MADRWYCNLQGREIGPLQLTALVEMSRKGSLNPDDRVRKGEHGAWAKASTVAGLFPEKETEGSLEVVSTLDELSIDIAGATDMPSSATIGLGEKDRAGTVSADPAIISDLSELDFKFADGSSRSDPERRQPDDSRPPGSEVIAVEEWYCDVLGQTLGPMPFDDLKQMVDNDELSATDRVRKGASGAWMAAASVSGLIPEDDFDLAPMVVVPSPDAPLPGTRFASQTSVSATPLTTEPSTRSAEVPDRRDQTPSVPEPVLTSQAEPPSESPTTADTESATGTASSPQTDLKDWLNEETADAAEPPPRRPDVTQTATPAESPAPSTKTGADKRPVAASRKVAPRRPKPARPRRPRRSLGDLFAPIAERGKPLAIIGGGIFVVGLLVFFFMSSGFTLSSHDKEYYEAYLSLYNEFRSLREQNASEAEWSSFIDKSAQQNKSMLNWLTTAASPKYPARQFLLFVGRDNWPAMISTARKKPSMDEWRLVTNLNYAHTKIKGTTAPPELPKKDIKGKFRLRTRIQLKTK